MSIIRETWQDSPPTEGTIEANSEWPQEEEDPYSGYFHVVQGLEEEVRHRAACSESANWSAIAVRSAEAALPGGHPAIHDRRRQEKEKRLQHEQQVIVTFTCLMFIWFEELSLYSHQHEHEGSYLNLLKLLNILTIASFIPSVHFILDSISSLTKLWSFIKLLLLESSRWFSRQ